MLEVLALEPRPATAEVVLREVVDRLDLAGEEAAPERAVGDESDPELAHRRENLVLDVARPERILGLERRDRVHRVRPANRGGRRLREAEVLHLAGLHELLHRTDRLFDRRVEVDAVLVVEVDVVDAEPLEARVTGLANVLGAAVDADPAAVRIALVAELRREHDLVAAIGDRSADELFVGERPVHVGGVEEVDTELDRAMDRRDCFAFVGRSVELRHAHAAEAEGRDFELSKLAFLHRSRIADPGRVPSWLTTRS